MRILSSLIVLSFVCVSLSAAEPAKEEKPAAKYLNAAELYAYTNTALGIRDLMGQRVEIEVVVKIEREVPLVDIVKPDGIAKSRAIPAHLVSVTTQASELKKDERYVVKGIIVDQGYGAYMIYVHEVARAK